MSRTATKNRLTTNTTTKAVQAKVDPMKKTVRSDGDDRVLSAERIRIKLGYAGTRTLFNGVRLGLLLFFGLVGYLVAFMIAVRGIPNLMAAVQQGTGVTTKMPADVVIAGWIVPSLFLVATLFVVFLLAMRQLWRLLVRVRDRSERALFSLDEDRDTARQSTRRA